MDTTAFFRAVLPPEGIYVSAKLVKKRDGNSVLLHDYHDSIEALAAKIEAGKNTAANLYYSVSTVREVKAGKTGKGTRTQENTAETKIFFFDLDCGVDKNGKARPYPSWKDALKAIHQFVNQTGLPKPMVVHSGGGIHVYWRLEEALPPDRWQPIALALKETARNHGLDMDWSVPGDSARLLRPVGALNRNKGDKEVRCLIEAPEVPVEAIEACLDAAPAATPLAVPAHLKGRVGFGKSALAEAIDVDREYPLGHPGIIASKCQQIAWAIDNPDEVSEPFWYSMMGVAAHCLSAEETAIEWSRGHPGFNERQTLRKLAQWKENTTGPATCARFEDENEDGCKDCPFRGKITTPVQLGAQAEAVEIDETVTDKVAHEVEMPKGFKRTATGIKQVVDGTDVDLCPFDIYPVGYGKDEALGYETVRFKWNRKHVGWCDLTLRQAYLAANNVRDFTTAIADQGIVLRTKKQTETFQFMLRAYMDKLREKRAMTNLYENMGWKEKHTMFVLGNQLMRLDENGQVEVEEINLSSSAQRLGGELYYTKGSEETWIKFTRSLEQAKLYPQIFTLGFCTANILIAYTGLNGLVVNLVGPSGTGKTLSQYIGQSVWGDPLQLHFAAKFTPNSLYNRLGFYCHLPMTIDEATVLSDREVGEFLYMITQGQDKTRLNRAAVERTAKKWSTGAVTSSNLSMTMMLEAGSSATDAQLMRLLEIRVPKNRVFDEGSEVGRKIHQLVANNFGHLGPKFAAHILSLGEETVRKMIADHMDTFRDKYDARFSGEERYWEMALVLTDLALTICYEQGWVACRPDDAIRFVLDQIEAMRSTNAENKIDSFDLLSAYLTDHTATALTMMHSPPFPCKPVPIIARMPRFEVRIRYDIMRKKPAGVFDHGTVSIDRSHFRKWLSTKGADYVDVLNDFKRDGILQPRSSPRAYLGKDTDIKMGQCYVITLNLAHKRLRGILDVADREFEDQQLSNVTAISS